ncbi:MAG: AraC family transcriptional regulator [Lentisphaerota bacterium]
MSKKSTNQYQAEALRELFLDTLDFKLYSSGVSHKDLPYVESWTLRPDGYISQVLRAKSNLYFKDHPTLYINPGDATILPPNLWHRAETLKDSSQSEAIFRWAHFQFFVAHSIDVFSFFKLPHVLSGIDGEKFGDFNEKLTRIHENKDISAIESAAGIKKVAFELLDTMLKLVPMKENYPAIGEEIHKIEPALKYIEKNYARKITIADLAQRTNMSQTRFYVAFKNIIGLAPVEYLIKQRLKKSQRLLLMTELPIGEIAAQSGYEDQFFFSKLFKKHTGVTPSEYRQQAKHME